MLNRLPAADLYRAIAEYGSTPCAPHFAPEHCNRADYDALGGSAGSRLAEQLGILASDSTLLRKLRRKTVSEAAPPRVLGIDDWAWR